MKIHRDLIEQAIETFGVDAQVDHAIEEMGELITALMEMKRNTKNKPLRVQAVRQEIADALISLEQLAVIFDEEEVQKTIFLKEQFLTSLMRRYKEGVYNG
jgi:NTP pyrophosphatase (non-canonical NTP hydrolase)